MYDISNGFCMGFCIDVTEGSTGSRNLVTFSRKTQIKLGAFLANMQEDRYFLRVYELFRLGTTAH